MVSNPIAELFGHSPIQPLQEHMGRAVEAVELLADFFAASQRGDWKAAGSLQRKIVALEREADKLKSHVRHNLPKSLLMPVFRSDLLELVGAQDRIANLAKDIAGLVLGRRMTFPTKLQPGYEEFLTASTLTCLQAQSATDELDTLLKLGFGKRQLHSVESRIRELAKLERKSDKLQVKLRGRLFRLEDKLPPVDVMFLYKVIDLTGDLADCAEKVGHRLLVLVSV